MRIPRLYLPLPLPVGSDVTLPENTRHHVCRVLRLPTGAELMLFNGDGSEFQGRLATVTRQQATVTVTACLPRDVETPLPIRLAQGVSRGERMDYTLQKAVELGVAAIQPVVTERSVAALTGERWPRRRQHWQGIVIAACEQCERNRLPDLLEPLPLADWLATTGALPDLKLLLDPSATAGLGDLSPPSGGVTLLIGPEGGLSDREIELARSAGFVGVRLGPRILRTETAGVAALAALQVLWGDLG